MYNLRQCQEKNERSTKYKDSADLIRFLLVSTRNVLQTKYLDQSNK